MKKFLAIALAALLIAAMAIPAFAVSTGEVITDAIVPEVQGGVADTNAPVNSGDVFIEYGVDQKYTVTIPKDLLFDPTTLTVSATVSASDVQIAGDEQLVIKIKSSHQTEDENKVWQMHDTNNKSTPVSYWGILDLDVATGETDSESGEAIKVPNVNKLVNDDTILVVEAPEGDAGVDKQTKGSVTIDFFTNGTTQEGNYKDVFTFTIDVEATSDKDTFSTVETATEAAAQG